MEKHSIESWDQLVYVMLHPVAILQATPEQVTDWLATSIKLKESLRRQLFLDTLYNKTEEETELMVERHQVIVTTLLNLLFNYQFHESITLDQKKFYQQVAAQLEEILDYLKNNFSRFFNADLNLPLMIRLRAGRELEHQLKMILKAMADPESNTGLLQILERLITGLLNLKDETAATYYQVAYLKTLLKEIAAYFSATSCLPYASLTELLISWNFNDPVFIREVCTNLNTEMEKKESAECKLEFLRTGHKQLSQLLEINYIPFYSTKGSAQKAILDWMSQELAHLEWICGGIEKDVNEGDKIQTSLSVPALALFTRLFKEAGIYTNTNQMDIIKFVSNHFATQRQRELSISSLKNMYYQNDASTKRKVYEQLMGMAQLCKKM